MFCNSSAIHHNSEFLIPFMAKSLYFPTITQKLKNGYNKRRCPQHLFQCILYGLLVHWLSTFLGSNLNPDREY